MAGDEVTKRRPVGRPSEYDPAYCEKVVEWGAQGWSFAEMAAELGIAKQTLYNWRELHTEFMDACLRAQTQCQRWWEREGRTGMTSSVFNGNVWAKNMSNRFQDDWREKSEVKHVITHEDALEQLE